jgi:hypothetical protein
LPRKLSCQAGAPRKNKRIFSGEFPKSGKRGMPFSEKGGSIFWGRLRKVFFYFSVEPGKKGAPFFKKFHFRGGPGGGRGGGAKMGGAKKIPREK